AEIVSIGTPFGKCVLSFAVLPGCARPSRKVENPRSMPPLRLAVVALLVPLAGCTPQIGDNCEVSTDCSQLGDRLCDTSQPDGYCTIFNCEPDTCPDSVCVGFNFELDPTCSTEDDGRWGRFERTFCMAPCSSTDDCNDGYVCLPPRARSARIVDSI